MQKLERLVEERALPDLFAALGGKTPTAEGWETLCRPQLKRALLEHIYGQFPSEILAAKVETKTNRVNFAGKAVWEEVTFTFERGGKTHAVKTQLVYPTNAKNLPFFISLQFDKEVPNRFMPTEEIIDGGFGVFSVCYHDVTRDNPDFEDGLAGLFSSKDRAPDEAGKIVCWAYMASRMLDYLLTRPEADKNRVGVIGHSRLGKTALLAAAFDERFAVAFSNNSGCSGAALSRGTCAGGERIENVYETFPYWFCKNYARYKGAEEKLPVDQHALIALIAPRRVFVGAAVEDVWADTNGQLLSLVAANKVWRLYQKRGLVCPDRLPEIGDEWAEGELCYHLRAGKHFLSRFDWNTYMNAWKKFW